MMCAKISKMCHGVNMIKETDIVSFNTFPANIPISTINYTKKYNW